MSDICMEFLLRLSVASLFLAATGVFAFIVICLLRCRSPFIHTATWCLVLSHGVLLCRIPVNVPLSTVWHQTQRTARGTDSDAVLPPESDEVAPSTTRLVAESNALSSWAWPQYVFLAWLAGVAFFLGKWLVAYVKFLRGVNWGECDLDEWNSEWSEMQQKNGNCKPIPLHVSHSVGPFLCWFPTGYRVVIPFSLWQQLSKKQRQAALQHELSHYERGDVLKVLLVHLMALPHWFNPIARFATRKFEDGPEWACDDAVRKSMPDATVDFAKVLLTIAELAPQKPPLTTAVDGVGVSQRIRRVLSSEAPEESRFKNGFVLSIVVLFLFLHVTRVNLVAQEAITDTAEKKSRIQLIKEWQETDEYKLMRDLMSHVSGHTTKVSEPSQLPHVKPTELALYGKKITDETLKQVARFADLESLAVFQTRVEGPGLKHLVNLENLETLIFTGPQVTDSWLRSLPEMKKLRNVMLMGSKITDSGLLQLKRFPTIRFLSLRNTNIGDSGLEVFQHLPVLTALDLHGTLVSDKGLVNLKYTPHVDMLKIASPNIRGPGLAHLCSLNNLGQLGLSGENVTRDSMTAVEPLRDVYRLQLFKTRVTDNGLAELRNWKNLESLEITDETITDGAIKHLKQLSSTHELHLETQIGNQGISRLQELLPDTKIVDLHAVKLRLQITE